MELIILALLGFGAMFAFDRDEDDADALLDPPQEPEAEEPPVVAQDPAPDAADELAIIEERADGLTIFEEDEDGYNVIQGTEDDDIVDASTFERDLDYEVRAGDGDDVVSRNSEDDAENRSRDTTNAFFGRIFGEEGNDLIDMEGRQSVDFFYKISGGIGDDTIISGDLTRVQGDAGDDLIIMGENSEPYTGLAFGGEGNDTLVGSQTPQMFGEAGDDVLNIHHRSGINGISSASGGAGNDMINIATGLGDVFGVGEGLRVEGNDGSDTFTLDLSIVDDTNWESGSAVGSTGIDIVDFNPNEDSLVIDVEAAVGEEDSTYEARLFERSENVYGLVLAVIEDDLAEGTRPRFTNFTIRTTGQITFDDIVFTDRVPLLT
ncbi:hypothetical protein ABMC88_02200 [Sulfitobacter sp. HNIBRBA2951]|uniref:hypothetical protein n=1 Tax=Sulfitobacter aquimarinus TaxID=3158557 RepID=UPI0032E04FB8